MKNVVSLMIIGALIFAAISCSEDDFSSKYVDPNKVTSVSIPNLMTGTFRETHNYSVFGYYRGLGMEGTFHGKFAQSYGFSYDGDAYFPGYSDYTEGQFDSFYGAFRQYVYMLEEYNKLSDAEKTSYNAFIQATRVHLYQWLLECVDMYGDMPFTEACRLPITMSVEDSYAAYDKADAIYSQVLDDLKTAADFFVNPASIKLSLFGTQDYVCRGDFAQWARYANSLRLRYALRVSQHGPLAEKGKGILKEIIENPDKYPVVLTNENNVFLKNDHSDQLNFGTGGFDWVSCRMASGPLLDRMLSAGNAVSYKGGTGIFAEAIDDPRTKILFSMRTESTDLPEGKTDGLQSFFYYDVGTVPGLMFKGMDIANKRPISGYYNDVGYSEIVQGGILWENNQYEHVQITASEVQFIIAEAYQRGWGVAQNTTKAEDAFKSAVTQSIALYYHWNETSEKGKVASIATPSSDEMEAYAAARWVSAVNPKFPYSFELEGTGETDEKIAAILTQKWVHWGIFFSRQSWSQLRRTGIPKLIYPSSGGSVNWPPDRWRYPATERNYNPNYPGTAADDYEIKLFWADPRGMRHSVQSGSVWTDQY
jgi:hypothetical protein